MAMKTAEYLPLFFYLHPLTPQLGLLIETTVLVQIETGHTLNTKITGAICDYTISTTLLCTLRITSDSSGSPPLRRKPGRKIRNTRTWSALGRLGLDFPFSSHQHLYDHDLCNN